MNIDYVLHKLVSWGRRGRNIGKAKKTYLKLRRVFEYTYFYNIYWKYNVDFLTIVNFLTIVGFLLFSRKTDLTFFS